MGNVIRHPSAERYEHKIKREAEVADATAAAAKHREWLKDTRPKRDAAKARRKQIRSYLDGIESVAWKAEGDDTFAILNAALAAARKAATAIRRHRKRSSTSGSDVP